MAIIKTENLTYVYGEGTPFRKVAVDNVNLEIEEGEMVYMESGKQHGLRNTGTEDMHVMFVYAPKMVADHWAQEQSGELK